MGSVTGESARVVESYRTAEPRLGALTTTVSWLVELTDRRAVILPQMALFANLTDSRAAN
ncbi:hypothetical protein [Paenibacillus sp. P36]|uniref:hypothetical protein n=1 Tax=Paenibacillus sp. P36 TaxID=3342538 RepID=UPI0038B292D0